MDEQPSGAQSGDARVNSVGDISSFLSRESQSAAVQSKKKNTVTFSASVMYVHCSIKQNWRNTNAKFRCPVCYGTPSQ